MGTNGIPWSKTGLDGRIIMLRKRNNSSSEIANGKYIKIHKEKSESKRGIGGYLRTILVRLNLCKLL